jgi:hypothetical protein
MEEKNNGLIKIQNPHLKKGWNLFNPEKRKAINKKQL